MRGEVLKKSGRMVLCAVAIVTTISVPGARAADVPRFASLRADEVNLRTGPGTRYPVDWVLVKRHMPVEIIDEFENWRQVRDISGTAGWVHRSMLSGRRTMIVMGGQQRLYRGPSGDSEVIALVDDKVVGRLLNCSDTWCRVEVAGMRGWLRRNRLWGVRRGEKIE